MVAANPASQSGQAGKARPGGVPIIGAADFLAATDDIDSPANSAACLTYRIEPLADHHDLTTFEYDKAELDAWLRDHARTATGQGTRTYVLVDASSQVVAYFAIAPHTIDRESLSKKTGRGAPQHIPAILLAKLALAESLHGRHLGSELLIAALDTIVEAARRAGGKFVVVDAIDDEAAAFYAHHEFATMPANPLRFTRKLSTIAKAINKPWP